MTSLDHAVQRGAEFLDEHRPGWVDEIDVQCLDIGNPFNCIVGQLEGGWSDGLESLGLTEEDSVRLGFDAPDGPWMAYDLDELTELWVNLINDRRES